MKETCGNCYDLIEECKCGETEGYSSEGAVCPYCGHVDLASESEGYIYDDSNDDNDCPSCNKTYNMDLFVSYTWTTTK